jgi:hypothetical protein
MIGSSRSQPGRSAPPRSFGFFPGPALALRQAKQLNQPRKANPNDHAQVCNRCARAARPRRHGFRGAVSDGGKVASATILSLSNFGGGPKPLAHPERLLAADAKFDIAQVVEGRIAAPVKQDGQVWQRIDRGIALTK